MTAGVVVWVSGLPSAGKSTLARGLLDDLRARGVAVCSLDGDCVRESLVPAPGYSEQERANFYETLARLAALLAGQGLVVLVPATAHRRAFRERARALAPQFVEVWVDTPLEECRRRDSKGLYAASERGGVAALPGAAAEYEPPVAPDVVARGGSDVAAIAAITSRLLQLARAPAGS